MAITDFLTQPNRTTYLGGWTCNSTDHYVWSGWSDTNETFRSADLEAQAMVELEWKMMWSVAKDIGALLAKRFVPLLLVFKRYDFRSAPRWRSERWKAKS